MTEGFNLTIKYRDGDETRMEGGITKMVIEDGMYSIMYFDGRVLRIPIDLIKNVIEEPA
jgi:hypothetical protein